MTSLLRRGYRFGRIHPEAIAALACRRARDDEHGAFLDVPTTSPEDARASERRWKEGRLRSRLEGVPFAAKDNLLTTDLGTTAGSRMLEDWRAPHDATVVRRLRAAGAVLVGKTNLDEFGMGATGELSAFHTTRNPRFPAWAPGGSSSGSAAAVASGIVPFALGSDTGGSVRLPAAFCRVVGFKPSYGRVSRRGLIAFASSMDCIGILASTVVEAADAFSIISGADPRDQTSVVPGLSATKGALRIGLLEREESTFWTRAEPGLRWASSRGHQLCWAEAPPTDASLAAYHVISCAEAASNLARYDGIRFGQRVEAETFQRTVVESRRAGLGPEVQRRIALGSFILSAENQTLKRAVSIRRDVVRRFEELFERFDLLFSPTAPEPIGLGQTLAERYALDRHLVGPSLAGLCALTLPLPPPDRPPVSLQVIGPAGHEALLFEIAGRLETSLSLHELSLPILSLID
ncbi:MAG: amidase family protein [Myxococcota bacterium]